MGETFAVEVRIEAPAAAVWAVVGDPEAVPRWYPTYVRSTVAGDVRTLERADGVVLEERLADRQREALAGLKALVEGSAQG